MTGDQSIDIENRTATLKGLLDVLRADLLMIGVYQELGGENDVIGARQAACAAMAKIEENLTILKGYCDA